MRLPNLQLPRFLKLGPRRWSDALEVNSKLLVAAPLAFTLIVGTGVIARSHRGDEDSKPAPAIQPPRVAALPRSEAAPAKPAPAETPPQAQSAPQKVESPKPAREPKVAHKAKEPAPKAAVPTPRAAETDTATAAPPPKPREPETVAIASPREGTVNIIALPWAEVFVDGTRQGVSPPLKAIPLRAGKHKVELRNGSFPPHVQTVELRPGTEINITHRFRR